MNEELRQEVFALLNKAQEEMKAGNVDAANATLEVVKDKIKHPLPGTGSNGEIHK